MLVHFGLSLEEITVEVRSVTSVTLLQLPLPVACTGSASTLGLASESLGLCGGEPGTSRRGASPRAPSQPSASLARPGVSDPIRGDFRSSLDLPVPACSPARREGGFFLSRP